MDCLFSKYYSFSLRYEAMSYDRSMPTETHPHASRATRLLLAGALKSDSHRPKNRDLPARMGIFSLRAALAPPLHRPPSAVHVRYTFLFW